jgi:UPF0271 protein
MFGNIDLDIEVDLNCDLGEGADPELESALLQLVTSVNIACGGHAGNPETMRRLIAEAASLGVALGAHPSYPDPERFGRHTVQMAFEDLQAAVAAQVNVFAGIAAEMGVWMTHIKPHGALYNDAAENRDIANAIADGLKQWRESAVLVGLARSAAIETYKARGWAAASEGFADRTYDEEGRLRPRDQPDAVIIEPAAAAMQAVNLARTGFIETICIHSDTPGSVKIAEEVVRQLKAAGIRLAPLLAES